MGGPISLRRRTATDTPDDGPTGTVHGGDLPPNAHRAGRTGLAGRDADDRFGSDLRLVPGAGPVGTGRRPVAHCDALYIDLDGGRSGPGKGAAGTASGAHHVNRVVRHLDVGIDNSPFTTGDVQRPPKHGRNRDISGGPAGIAGQPDPRLPASGRAADAGAVGRRGAAGGQHGAHETRSWLTAGAGQRAFRVETRIKRLPQTLRGKTTQRQEDVKRAARQPLLIVSIALRPDPATVSLDDATRHGKSHP